jgi:hypothetical protein
VRVYVGVFERVVIGHACLMNANGYAICCAETKWNSKQSKNKICTHGSQCKHKIVFEYHSSVGGNVEKTKIVFPYYDHHKNHF